MHFPLWRRTYLIHGDAQVASIREANLTSFARGNRDFQCTRNRRGQRVRRIHGYGSTSNGSVGAKRRARILKSIVLKKLTMETSVTYANGIGIELC